MTNRIEQLRKKMGLTQQETADKIGVSKAAIAQYESGKIKSISPDRLLKLSRLFQAPPAYIMGWSDMSREPDGKELALIDSYRQLNYKGKKQIDLRLWELSQISDYTNDIIVTQQEDYLAPVAAHADGADIQVLKSEVERIKKLIAKKQFKE